VIVSGTGYVTGPRADAGQRLEAHLKYIQYRAGGEGPRIVFGETEDALALRDAHEMILDQGRDGLRFHKIVISPAESERVGDWTAFTRQVMDDLGRRVGLQLTWCATVHQNTDHPHVHIVLAGDGERADGRAVQVRLYTPHYEFLRERAEWHTEQAWDNIAVSMREELVPLSPDAVSTREWRVVDGRQVADTRAGAGGHWHRKNERPDPRAVRQVDKTACVSAGGEILLRQHGISAGSQAEILENLGTKAGWQWLQKELAKYTPATMSGQWISASVDVEPGHESQMIDRLNRTGAWGAVMQSPGTMLHLVVIVGVDTDDDLVILDPYNDMDPTDGTSYTMTREDFINHWMLGVTFWQSRT